MPEYSAKWAAAPEFAEVAEALRIQTDMVLGMAQSNKGGYTVLFTPALDYENPEVYAAYMKRDEDGILGVYGEPELQPGYWERMKRHMEEQTGEQEA